MDTSSSCNSTSTSALARCLRVDTVDSDCTRHYVACPYKERAARVCMQIQVHENALSTSSGGAQLRTLLLLKNTFSGVHESGGDVFLTLVFRSPSETVVADHS